MTRKKIVDSARGLVGTPWIHQGRRPFVGLDCIGVVVCAHDKAGYPLVDCADYGRNPNPKKFLGILSKQFARVTNADTLALESDVDAWRCAVPGDVVVFQFQGSECPQHIGICSGSSIIHAHLAVGACVEHAMSLDWQRRVHSVWKHKAIA